MSSRCKRHPNRLGNSNGLCYDCWEKINRNGGKIRIRKELFDLISNTDPVLLLIFDFEIIQG